MTSPYYLCSIYLAVFISLTPCVLAGDGFLVGPSPGSAQARTADFVAAMGTVMGCGNSVDAAELTQIERALGPIWRVLPKNSLDRVEWRMLRYAAHRYFMQRSSLLIRGFEPARRLNSSDMFAAQILDTHAPPLLQQVLEGKAGKEGFSFEEAVSMVATMDRLIFDAEHALVSKAFADEKIALSATFDRDAVNRIMESYVINWLLGTDPESLNVIKQNRSLMYSILPHWEEIMVLTSGMMRSLEFEHRKDMTPHGHAHLTFSGPYNFEDVHEIVGSLTKTFASYWETECQTVKTDLVALDKTGTGRISLNDFYGANADGEWRFGESEEYLRELGALDESSAWYGKQVIIANYIQGASNCIVATSNYLICCKNECETVLSEIEDTVGAAVASPHEIVTIVKNIALFDEDERPKLDKVMVDQLRRVAETHGGQVPLHGRLFGQWLHYVFPRECPFPHKSGTISSLSPVEFGEFMVSVDELERHATARGSTSADPSLSMQNAQAEAQWMTQWSEEEELHGDYSGQLRAAWERSSFIAFSGIVLLGVAVLVWTGVLKVGCADDRKSSSASTPGVGRISAGFEQKAHFV